MAPRTTASFDTLGWLRWEGLAVFRRIIRLGAVVLALGAVLLIPEAASAASKPTTSVTIVSGTVAAGGASIQVRYDCFPSGYGPYNAFGSVRVGQVSGATGDTFFHPLCNDVRHTQPIFVAGNFTKADAAVSAFICGFDCNSATAEIRLR
jgi:hypothetical protein